MELQWYFPDNGNGMEFGLETGDIDIFKKDPIGSLAREICQNSIDANRGTGATKIEFKPFKVKREDIPGIDDLANQIEKCYEYRKNDKKEGAAIATLHSTINSDEINCLRISDYNTTGLIGVSRFERGMPFYNLTKTSGTSFKRAGCGGSKGIGKAAAFVASNARTVFYSTYTEDEEKGYIGIAKLRSVPIDEHGYKMSVAEGYYGIGKESFPQRNQELVLDKAFHREAGNYGTDLYLIGFGYRENWKTDLIFKLLDSFMVAFSKGLLEVTVDDIVINKFSLKSIIRDNTSFPGKSESSLKSLKAQYELLSGDDGVKIIEKEIKDYGSVTIYVQPYSPGEAYRATGSCDIIRYPYMKITSYGVGRLIPYSAMCIVENGDLNEALRQMENAEHTDWAPERLEEDADRKRGATIIRSLRNQISRAINEALKTEVGEKTDIVGAGAYLPSVDNDEVVDREGDAGAANEFTHVGKIRTNECARDKAEQENNDGEKIHRSITTSVIENTGTPDAEITTPDGDVGNTGIHNGGGSSGDHGSALNPTDANTDPNGNKKGRIRKLLGGMRTRNIYDKNKNGFVMTFTSQYNEDDCEIVIKEIGESSDTYDVTVISATIDGKPCLVEKGVIKGIVLRAGEKYSIFYNVQNGGRFATGVDIYANR